MFAGALLGMAWIRVVSVVITLVIGGVAVAAALRFREVRQEDGEAAAYLGLAGMVVAAMLLVYLTWSLVAALLYPTCPG